MSRIVVLPTLLLAACTLLDSSGDEPTDCPQPPVPEPSPTEPSTPEPTTPASIPGFWRGACEALPENEELRWFLDLALDESRGEIDGLGRLDPIGKDVDAFDLFEVDGFVFDDGTVDVDWATFFVPVGVDATFVGEGALQGDILTLQLDLEDGMDRVPYLDCTLDRL